MEVESTYDAVSGFFHAWVGLMENHTREMEVRDSVLRDSKILIISPPTDTGIGALTRANQCGASYLLCFSARAESIAKEYCQRHGIQRLQTVVAPFFSIPFRNREFDIIFANCFFDCCLPRELNPIIDELRRALRQGGTLYSVHMGIPSGSMNHVWAWLLRRIPGPGRGFAPVSIVPSLASRGFTILRNRQPERFGFPLRYVQAKKPEAV